MSDHVTVACPPALDVRGSGVQEIRVTVLRLRPAPRLSRPVNRLKRFREFSFVAGQGELK
jgi:hypothetical protein